MRSSGAIANIEIISMINNYYVVENAVYTIQTVRFLHCVQTKTPTYIFNYNSGISWSIFYDFCTSKNRNKYPTIYLLTVLMTS